MNYLEALEYREKNLHLVGMEYKESTIGDVFIYPKEPDYWDEFIHQFSLRKGEPLSTARLFPSKDFGLKIYLTLEFSQYIFHHDLGSLPEEYKVILLDDY